ncbi:hypothetical protein GOP47_0021426 [Adiantum capillus-veneris]|uniref:Uncharacterized protein n=1 Tax=Adiantum capillus-veneris TaxID=13818 RepID=A0A9D4U985_ADICA|nr:hypothetical protein GOP47_0021426 [Adiantum capillus-veneris]
MKHGKSHFHMVSRGQTIPYGRSQPALRQFLDCLSLLLLPQSGQPVHIEAIPAIVVSITIKHANPSQIEKAEDVAPDSIPGQAHKIAASDPKLERHAHSAAEAIPSQVKPTHEKDDGQGGEPQPIIPSKPHEKDAGQGPTIITL